MLDNYLLVKDFEFDELNQAHKSKMIENFVTATEKFISDLQDSGEFVSLQEDGEEDENPSDDRDGGYFK